MPRGYRCIFVAVVGWLALVGQAPQNTSDNKTAAAQQAIQNSVPPATPAVDETFQDPEYQRPCKRGEDNRRSDLCAQWKAADAARDAANWAWYQLGISFFGVIGLGWTIWFTARSTRAAIEALEAQIATERPLMHIEKIKLLRQEPTPDSPLRYRVDWSVRSHGKTGCWVEQVNVTLKPGNDPSIASANGTFKLSSFVAPEKALATVEGRKVYSLTPSQALTARDTKQLSATGYVLYRDAARREWQTGYAMLIDLTDEMDFKTMYPIPKPEFWFDLRRK